MRLRWRTAFTRAEFLVLLGVSTLFSGFLLPAIAASRAADERAGCRDRLAKLGRAMLAHEGAHGGLPPRRTSTPARRGFGVDLLPFLGEDRLAGAYHHERDYYHPVNRPVSSFPLKHFQCPAAVPDRMVVVELGGKVLSDYRTACGDYFTMHFVTDPRLPRTLQTNQRQAMADDRVMTLDEISDGTAFTLLLTEQAGRPEHWIKGVKQEDNRGLTLARFWAPWAGFTSFGLRSFSADGRKDFGGECLINCNNAATPYSFHVEGVHNLFVDGSVKLLGPRLDPFVYYALVTRDGGEVIDASDL